MARRSSEPIRFSGDEKFVILHGKEAFLRTARLRALREAVEKKLGDETDLIRFDESATLADVLDEVRSVGLMQQHKIVVVDGADAFVKSHRQALERYAKDPVDTATLVLRSETWHAGNLDKMVAKIGAVASCETVKPAEAEQWIVRHARDQHNVKIDPRAASSLVDHLGCDLGRLDSELGKLAASVPPGGSITAQQIDALVGRASEEKAWEIQAALLSGDAGQMLRKLDELIELAQNPEIVVLFAASDLMRKLVHAAEMLGQRANDFAICKALRIWPQDRQRPFIAAARKLGIRKASALLKVIVDVDMRSKSGLGDFRSNLERFCVQFATALR